MRFSWLKWILIVAVLFIGSAGNAHGVADHAGAKAEPCAAHHQHHQHPAGQISHDDCCCSCFGCPAGVVTPVQGTSYRPVAQTAILIPAGETMPATLSPSPEIDPPRPGALI